jgi:predicted N-acetyltransferase YhbS
MTPTIRYETPADHKAVRHVHRLTFGRDDEAGIVDALRAGGHSRVSLVAEVNGGVVGHVLFGDLPVLTDGGTVAALSLAPTAVRPEFQRRGVGSALVRAELDDACRAAGHRIVVVLGHPAFYPRFGFSAGRAERLSSPFGGGEAWMALELEPGALGGVTGWVRYPPPFGAGVQVRPVYRPDRGEWVRLRTALWPDGGGEHGDDVDTFFDTGTFRSSEALLPWKVFVAERPGGGLCGFVEASIRPLAEGCSTRPVGYVEGWFVDPDVRWQGVGRRLVTTVEGWAATNGCEEMASDADADNAVSHEAHRAVGFEESGRLIHFRKRLDGPPEEADRRFTAPRLTLLEVAGRFAVCKLPTGSAIPAWATAGDVFSVTRTADELSVVCRPELVPEGAHSEAGWRGLRVAGVMPFTLVGVLAALTTPIAGTGVGVFAFSTFDTDYLLVKEADFPQATAALRAAGHQVEQLNA